MNEAALPARGAPAAWKGLLSGLAGGLAGAWVMTQFHVTLYGRGVTATREPQSHRPTTGGSSENASTVTAELVARTATGEGLSGRGRQRGAVLVHYGFGATMGALYGLMVETRPEARQGQGTLFGALVWAGADELALPPTGLADGPDAYPADVHTEMFVAHLVFGVTVEAVRARVRQMLDRWS